MFTQPYVPVVFAAPSANASLIVITVTAAAAVVITSRSENKTGTSICQESKYVFLRRSIAFAVVIVKQYLHIPFSLSSYSRIYTLQVPTFQSLIPSSSHTHLHSRLSLTVPLSFYTTFLSPTNTSSCHSPPSSSRTVNSNLVLVKSSRFRGWLLATQVPRRSVIRVLRLRCTCRLTCNIHFYVPHLCSPFVSLQRHGHVPIKKFPC